jgi:hypothetical protein
VRRAAMASRSRLPASVCARSAMKTGSVNRIHGRHRPAVSRRCQEGDTIIDEVQRRELGPSNLPRFRLRTVITTSSAMDRSPRSATAGAGRHAVGKVQHRPRSGAAGGTQAFTTML